jgi:hypothetical protein
MVKYPQNAFKVLDSHPSKLDNLEKDSAKEMLGESQSEDLLSSGDSDPGTTYLYSFHSCTIMPRMDGIPKLIKVSEKQRLKMRHFDKADSVFKDWRQDGEHVLNQCFRDDLKYWKAPQFITKKKDL